ncbi:hypothetical protein OIU84_004862 [Salix udensis]|uniref:Uncharacterized protein n=1 Tax=Salix udensis TaxID=889485 RepID=A0AAD6P4V8_9ROSI|nr:hypothetical protein OIU84_004862 [Salix udensis]
MSYPDIMASSSSPLKLTVKRCEPQLIPPSEPTPHELKPLSDIDDQRGTRSHFPFIMFYHGNPSMKGKDPAVAIKEALGKALVFYYPLAGRVIEGPRGKLLVDCTGEGILFVEADADVTVDQLGDSIQPPCSYIEEFLHDVPGSSGVLGCPLLLIQVTRLVCGGFIFAIRLNHTVSDTPGMTKFLNTVGEMAVGASTPSQLPVWEREILNARNPPRVTCVHHEYDQLTHTETSITMLDRDQKNMIHRSFFFGPGEIKSIRKQIPPHLQKCSNLEVLTSFLWRCRTIALHLDPDEVVRLSCTVNLRGKQTLKLPVGYYGNAFALPTAISEAGILCQSPLGYALELVRRLKTQMNEEYLKSVADLMVLNGRPHYTTVWNFLIGDVTRVGLGDIDFGWGKPVYGGPAGALPCSSYFIGGFKNSSGEEGVLVPVLLPLPIMNRFQQELFSNGIDYPVKITPKL